MNRSDTVQPFDDDVVRLGGYEYTTSDRLSTRLANARLTEAAAATVEFRGRRVLDIGSGDGEYTIAVLSLGARVVTGIDPSLSGCIAGQRKRKDAENVRFISGSAYSLPFPDNSFDLGHLRGVLHHMDRPLDALREALRVCSTIVVIEPNGYNPVLKLLERCSSYHRQHEEKSYPAYRLREWIDTAGGHVISGSFAGLVPMFCPDWVARTLKRVEPRVEGFEIASKISCAVYVFSAVRKTKP